MNKTELVKKVAAENALSQKQAAAVVDCFGFGTFSVKHRDARQGRNPATGEAMEFAASNTPVFKAGKAFKEKVNK